MWYANCCMWTDGRTRRSLLVALSNHANAPTKHTSKFTSQEWKTCFFPFRAVPPPPLQQMVTRTPLDVTSHEHRDFACLDEFSHGAPHTDKAHDTETPGTKRPSAGRVLLSCTNSAHLTANEIRRHWRIKINWYWNKTHFQSRPKCDYT